MYKQHAELSASSAVTWIRCPASILAQRGKPNTDSEFARYGTAGHHLAAWCLQNNANADSCLGRVIVLIKQENGKRIEFFEGDHLFNPRTETRLDEFTVDEEMADAVQIYLDIVREYTQNGTLFTEVRVPLAHITTEEDAEGTSDALILSADYKEIIVIDLKMGQGVQVYAEENEQLQMYALGALEWLDIAGMADQVEVVRLVISQPRKSHAPSEWDLPIADLRSFGVRANLSAVQGLTSDLPTFNPGAKQCKWCRAKADCPEAQRVAIGTVIDNFDVVGSDQQRTEVLLETAAFNLVKADNERLGWLLSQLAFIEDWTKAVRARAEERIFRGDTIPGYKIVDGKKGNRAWIDEDGAEKLMRTMKLKVEEMFTQKLKTPTQMEKVLKKEKAKQWERLDALVIQPEGAKAIVPLTDPRPAVVIVPIADQFENVEEPLA